MEEMLESVIRFSGIYKSRASYETHLYLLARDFTRKKYILTWNYFTWNLNTEQCLVNHCMSRRFDFYINKLSSDLINSNYEDIYKILKVFDLII